MSEFSSGIKSRKRIGPEGVVMLDRGTQDRLWGEGSPRWGQVRQSAGQILWGQDWCEPTSFWSGGGGSVALGEAGAHGGAGPFSLMLSTRGFVPQEALPEPFEHLLQRIARRPKPQQFFGLMGKRDAGEMSSSH